MSDLAYLTDSTLTPEERAQRAVEHLRSLDPEGFAEASAVAKAELPDNSQLPKPDLSGYSDDELADIGPVTIFTDYCTGGTYRLPYQYIYVESEGDDALEWFRRTFGVDPWLTAKNVSGRDERCFEIHCAFVNKNNPRSRATLGWLTGFTEGVADRRWFRFLNKEKTLREYMEARRVLFVPKAQVQERLKALKKAGVTILDGRIRHDYKVGDRVRWSPQSGVRSFNYYTTYLYKRSLAELTTGRNLLSDEAEVGRYPLNDRDKKTIAEKRWAMKNCAGTIIAVEVEGLSTTWTMTGKAKEDLNVLSFEYCVLYEYEYAGQEEGEEKHETRWFVTPPIPACFLVPENDVFLNLGAKTRRRK